MKIIKPKKLNKGDVVGIISPSSPIRENLREQFNRGVSFLENELGLRVKIGKHIFDQHYYNAGTREARIEDFNAMWKDSDVKMVLMSQGGTTANHLLDGIDYKIIKNNPKIFSGISDGTTLLNAIFAKTGLITYHGPDLLWTFGNEISSLFQENFIKTLFGGNVGELHPNPAWQHDERKDISYQGWQCVREGKATGILVGGHLGCLSCTVLAGYGPDFKDKILFLEGTNDVAHLDRFLTALKLRGVFGRIKGLILGWFEDHEMKEKDRNREVADMVLEVTKNYSFPVLEIGELGHNVENYILPIGCKATIDADKKYLSIDELTVI